MHYVLHMTDARLVQDWMIHRLREMLGSAECLAGLPDGRWVRAIAEPFRPGLIGRLAAAWAVLTERAHAVSWPEAGELEEALGDELMPVGRTPPGGKQAPS